MNLNIKVIIIKIIGYTWSSKNAHSEGKNVHLVEERGEGPRNSPKDNKEQP